MEKIKKIAITLILIIIAITIAKTNKIYAEDNGNISTESAYINDKTLTYRKLEDGELLISGFKIGEKVSEILNERFGEDYTIKIKNNKGTDITSELNQSIATGNKIELYGKSDNEIKRTYSVVIYGDTNGDGTIGAVDALAIIKNKIGSEIFTNKALEEAGRVKQETRISGVVPKSDDALYVIKHKLLKEQYPIEQKMLRTSQEEVVITFNANEGEVTPTNKIVMPGETYGELPLPLREGYTFEGWYTEENGGSKIESTTTVTVTEEQTLYAHWSVNSNTLIIKHYLENINDTNYTLSTTTTQNLAYGTQITLENYKTNIENGTYSYGSLTDSETGGTSITTTTMEEEKTIALYYTRNTYILTLVPGTNIASVTEAGLYKVGQIVTIDATLNTETGYTISWLNWTSNDTSLIANNSTKNVSITMPAGNVTLTANATKVANNYTVTCIDKVRDENGMTVGETTWSAPFGTIVSGLDAEETIYQDLAYSSCTSETVTTNGTTVYRFFTPTDPGTIRGINGWTAYTSTYDNYPTFGGYKCDYAEYVHISEGSTVTFRVEVTGQGYGGLTLKQVGGTFTCTIDYKETGVYSFTYYEDSGLMGQVGIYRTEEQWNSGVIPVGTARLTVLSITNKYGMPYTLN